MEIKKKIEEKIEETKVKVKSWYDKHEEYVELLGSYVFGFALGGAALYICGKSKVIADIGGRSLYDAFQKIADDMPYDTTYCTLRVDPSSDERLSHPIYTIVSNDDHKKLTEKD